MANKAIFNIGFMKNYQFVLLFFILGASFIFYIASLVPAEMNSKILAIKSGQTNNSELISNVGIENIDLINQVKQENSQVFNNDSKTDLESDITKMFKDDYKLGELNAPVKIIVYGDLTDSFTKDFYLTWQKIQSNYSDKVVSVWRYFFTPGKKTSQIASLALECAAEQKKYWPMHARILSASDSLDKNDFIAMANNLDLNIEQFGSCLNSNKYLAKIDIKNTEAKENGVYGSPTILINNELIVGARPWEDYTNLEGEKIEGIQSLIARQLNK